MDLMGRYQPQGSTKLKRSSEGPSNAALSHNPSA